MTPQILAASRIALSAFLHDLGKLAERAGIEVNAETLEMHQQLYCPHHKEFTDARGWFSHKHAAYTGLAWDQLEATGHFPDLRQDAAPFGAQENDATDSAINAAAAHHKPDTFLQWIIATADRVASGFERDKFDSEYNNQKERPNHYCARLLSLFEQVYLDKSDEDRLNWRLPLSALTPQSIFPQAKAECIPQTDKEAKAEYLVLWNNLLQGLEKIPRSHTSNLPLWLDHFDSLWLNIAHSIPSATAFNTKPEVSLYDHSKAVAALAVALWYWHTESGQESANAVKTDWQTDKFLLVQGDFFGIQDFIFATGGETQKHAHKLLRGRSFQVGMLADCAALKLLDALQLPPTSQIINAAGKFLIVAPNTAAARDTIKRTRKELNEWCLKNTYGEIGVGIATTPASCADFVSGNFGALTERLFQELEIAKLQRFDLCDENTQPVFADFLKSFNNDLGVCKINGRYPADPAVSQRHDRKYPLSALANDQICIGEALTKHARLLVCRESDRLPVLGLDYFGYRLAFVPEQDITGKYGTLASGGNLIRAWDFDAPEKDGNIWRGYARRFVNSYVPIFNESDRLIADKYQGLEADSSGLGGSPIKTLSHLACEDRRLTEHGRWRGEIALVSLKGDIDNLGELFQKGLEKPTFAKMAALSRQVHAFFALWLPWFCEHGMDHTNTQRFRNTYTVFAGGDDFFLIGPWESTLALASIMRKKFAEYVRNDAITFSAGLSMSHPKVPVRHLAHHSEIALQSAKAHADSISAKNAVSLWGHSVFWKDWQSLMDERRQELELLMDDAEAHGAKYSSGLIYALLKLSERAESKEPKDAIWRSQLHYRLARFYLDRIRGNQDKRTQRERLLAVALKEIGNGLNQYKGAYRLPLSVLLYRQRE